MNQKEMATQIRERVPILAKRDKSDWKKAEQLRKKFVKDFPIKGIKGLSLQEYVIGKGEQLSLQYSYDGF